MRGNIQEGVAAALRLAAGASLREAVDTTDPVAWVALDAGVRQEGWYAATGLWQSAWERTEAGRTLAEALRAGLTGGRGDCSAVEPLTEAQLALALCHREGRIRAAALAQATAFPDLLPLLVVRCSDWAPPVRDAARQRLVEILDAESAVRLLPLILRLGRRDRGDVVAGWAERLLRCAPRDTLAPLYAHGDPKVRRYVYRLAVDEGLLSPSELALAAARDADIVVQSLCADAAVAGLAGGAVADRAGYDAVLEPLLGARGAQARAAGVTALRRAGRPESAARFFGDRAGVVRACARYVVRQSGGEPVEWYRRRCADAGDPALSAGMVSGLAECGDRDDAEALWGLTSHPDPVVRARAVSGLRVLDVMDVRRMRALLDDPAPGVVREATLALAPSARSLDAGWLMERLAVGRAWQTRVSAFRLLDACGGIVRLRAAVVLVDDPDDKLRHWARQSVQRWRPAGDVPSGTGEVGELLGRARHLFSGHVWKRRMWEAGLMA